MIGTENQQQSALNSPSSAGYVIPFGVYVAFLGMRPLLHLPDLADECLWLAVSLAVLAWVARPLLDFRAPRWAADIAIGVAVFALWIAPDLFFPGYRHHWIFENPVMGQVHTGMSAAGQASPVVLALRIFRSAVIVPIVEELFWRAWMMRWLISPSFYKVPLGTYTPRSFWIVAVLFASEHGPYWDVGLLAGVIYNGWMVRSRRLGDLILTHAVTNASLGAYVILTGSWQYWS